MCVYVRERRETSACVFADLVTQHFGHVPVVLELWRISGQQCVPGQDGHGPQDEGGKQVAVDTVPGAPQLPSQIKHTTAIYVLR